MPLLGVGKMNKYTYTIRRNPLQVSCQFVVPQPRAWLLQNGFPDFTKKLWPSRLFLQSFSLPHRMIFTENLATLGIEAFPLHVFFAKRAVEALGVVVVVEGLHPPVPGLDGEAAGNALGGEQLVPVFLAVWQPVLQVEWAVSKDLVAVGAGEALGVEGGRHRLQAVPSYFFPALAAVRGKESAVAILTVKLAFFLDKSDVLKGLPAGVHGAEEVARTPRLPHRRDERTLDRCLAASADRGPHPDLLLLKDALPSPWSGDAAAGTTDLRSPRTRVVQLVRQATVTTILHWHSRSV